MCSTCTSILFIFSCTTRQSRHGIIVSARVVISSTLFRQLFSRLIRIPRAQGVHSTNYTQCRHSPTLRVTSLTLITTQHQNFVRGCRTMRRVCHNTDVSHTEIMQAQLLAMFTLDIIIASCHVKSAFVFFFIIDSNGITYGTSGPALIPIEGYNNALINPLM